MNLSRDREASATLERLVSDGFIAAQESGAVRRVLCDSRLHASLACAETIHLHVKVDDTSRIAVATLESHGAVLDHGRDGFVKYRLRGAINVIFSHIPVSVDDLREALEARHPRPFLDHIGIDMRSETAQCRAAFDAIPCIAVERKWGHVPQGGAGRTVRCCHAEVAAKHWIYPAAEKGERSIPIEFAHGALRHAQASSGCDLRPAHPDSAHALAPPCCAA